MRLNWYRKGIEIEMFIKATKYRKICNFDNFNSIMSNVSQEISKISDETK